MSELFSEKTSLKIRASIKLIRENKAFKSQKFTYISFKENVNLCMKELFQIHSQNKTKLYKELKEEMELFDLLLLEHLSLIFTLSPFFNLKVIAYKGLKEKVIPLRHYALLHGY